MKKFVLIVLPYLIAGGIGIAGYAAHSSDALVAMIGAFVLSALAHYNLTQDPKALGASSDAAAKAANKIGPAVVLWLLVGGAVALATHQAPTTVESDCMVVDTVAALSQAVGGPLLALEGCTNQQATQVKTIITDPNAAQCVEAVISDVTGSIDIAGTIAHCGVTIEQLVAYLESYFSRGDGGADAAVAGASPAKVQRVQALLDAAKAYQAAHQ
ncbi:MAG TPA: hypothetical protein VGH28_13750 [Polyangiaceae bacterium]